MAFEFYAELNEIFSGAQAGAEFRWTACNFFDKVILTTASVLPIYWAGATFDPANPLADLSRPVPGLDPTEYWDGVSALAGHLLLWKGTRIKWSDLNDFTTWIPVGQTASSVRATLAESFTHPKKGSTTGWIHFVEGQRSFTVGQYVRIDLYPDDPSRATYNFYLVAAAAATAGLDSETIGVSQVVSSTPAKVFTNNFVAWPVGSRLLVNGNTSALAVTDARGDQTLTLTLAVASAPIPLPDQTFTVNLSSNPTGLKIGDVVSYTNIGVDLYEVTHVGFSMTLKRLNIGTIRNAAGFVFPAGATFVVQPFVAVSWTGPAYTIPPGADITAQGAVKLTGLGLTGESTPGDTIAAKNILATVDANEAGEMINAGSQINGDVFAIVELDEYGVILKQKSIQSLQYTGFGNGVFAAHLELEDIGPIARNAWCRVDTTSLVFVGESEIYQYFGGKNIKEVGLQVTKEFFADLDRSRVDEIVLYHNKIYDQVWVSYPSLTQAHPRVYIYNYRENSAVIDDYPATVGTLTAVGAVHWEVAPTWRSLSDSQLWQTETKKWREYVEDGLQRHTILAVSNDTPSISELGEYGEGVPRLLLHGRVFHRASGSNCDPQPYLALAETIDFDFKDPNLIKYVDTIFLNVEIRPLAGTQLVRPLGLFIQFGCRDNLDSNLRWTAPARVEVSGNGMRTTKVNLRGYGRFIRVRFFSQQTDIQWRIAGFELLARQGGTI